MEEQLMLKHIKAASSLPMHSQPLATIQKKHQFRTVVSPVAKMSPQEMGNLAWLMWWFHPTIGVFYIVMVSQTLLLYTGVFLNFSKTSHVGIRP